MIDEKVNKGKGVFEFLINQLILGTNAIFKDFKLEINREPKAFKRNNNRRKSSPNNLHKGVGWILLDKSQAILW